MPKVGQAAAAAPAREIDNILDVQNDFELIQTLIDRHISQPARRSEYESRLLAIEDRANDPKLYLGVVGEFSSGKSTLINGLLRQELLKAAVVATTASVTRIQRGTEFSIQVVFTSGKKYTATSYHFEALRLALQRIVPELSRYASVKDLLHILTSNPAVAEKVRQMDVTVPSKDLDEQLVILDTPGINAGADEARNHAAVTSRAMEEMDSAIVLIPSGRPSSATLLSFLAEQAQKFLHRCVFVVTAMDEIADEDRAEVMQVVRRGLERNLGLKDPVVYESAALALVPTRVSLKSLSETGGWWRARFIEMEADMKKLMLRQRLIIIAERTLRLLNDLASDLNTDLESKRKHLEQEKKLLARGSVEAIETVVGQLMIDCEKRIREQRSSLMSLAAKLRAKARAKAVDASSRVIRDAGWEVTKYEERLAPRITEAVQAASASYIQDVNDTLSDLRARCEDIREEFVAQFRSNYRMFPGLRMEISVPAVSVDSIGRPSLSFSSSCVYTEGQNKEDNQGAGIGAVVGGILGSFLLPGIGTAIGATIGGSIGFGAAGDNLEERQRKLIAYAEDDIGSYFGELQSSVERSLDRTLNRVLAQFRRAAEAHIAEYGSAVAQLMAEHRERQRKLNAEVRKTIEDSKSLESRRNRFTEMLERLQTTRN